MTSYVPTLHAAWKRYGDQRTITRVVEVSAMVSTNHVYRVELDDGSAVIAKFSTYGSYFMFCEDHDRIHRCKRLLYTTRYRNFLADALTIGDEVTGDERVFTFYDGQTWAVFYEEVERRDALPKILTETQIDCLARELALFHLECARISRTIPPTSKSIRSDAVHLLELASNPQLAARFSLDADELAVVRHHAHELLVELERINYDYWRKIPVLIDWNLGNFSVDFETAASAGTFRLFSRWDYDWFRIEPRMLDFYFLSRVSSQTGDRTHFTYSPHTLVEPRFCRFVAAYHATNPITLQEINFLRESYRFFILNYVIAEGDHFFAGDLWRQFQREAVHTYLPAVDALDLSPLLAIVA